jgi:hypothetical protein
MYEIYIIIVKTEWPNNDALKIENVAYKFEESRQVSV